MDRPINNHPVELLFKVETGCFPVAEEELEFDIWRSKGQWVIDITDEEKFNISGNRGFLRFSRTDEDYLTWLEDKVVELLKLR